MSLIPEAAPSFRVALIYPTIKEGTGGCAPPCALFGLDTVPRDDGIGVCLFDVDAFRGDRAALVAAVAAYNPSLVGLPVFCDTYDDTAAALGELRKAGVSGPFVLGGPEATANPETIHAGFPDVPYVLAGEAEWTLRTLAERLRDRQDTDDISGLGYCRGASWIINPITPFTGIDQVPFPDRSLLGEAYAQGIYWRLGQRGTTDIVVSSRGCPYSRNSCLKVTQKTTLRPAASIHAELDHSRKLKTRFIHPGKDMESARETIDFIFRAKPTYVNWGMLLPLPGTSTMKELEGKGLVKGRYGVGKRPRVIYDYLADFQRAELNQFTYGNMRRYSGNLRHMVLPSFSEIVIPAGPHHYRILRDTSWKRNRPPWMDKLRIKARK